jgi:hypothetical protein
LTSKSRLKRPQQELFFPTVANVGMTVIEAVLAVSVGERKLRFGKEGAGPAVLLVKGRAGYGRIEHKLMKDGIMETA